VLKSIDETLVEVLGSTVRDAMYLALLTKFSVTREEVAKHIDTFQTMLENSCGPRVTKVLSRAIAKRLYSELHLTFVQDPAFGLPEYVEEAKGKLLKTNSCTAEKLDAEVRTHRNRLGEDDSN